MSLPPTRKSLQVLIESRGLRLTGSQYDQLWAYHGMLRAANEDLNMTRIHNFENMVLKHYVDCLLVLKFVELPDPLMDMGSGPGLPGIVLKIARPEIAMILAEPRGARVAFLEEVIARLGLKKIEVYGGKINSKFDRPVSGVITRAVASIPETLDRVANCLAPGGKLILMKGPDCSDEIREAGRSHADTYRLTADHAYAIPDTPHDRRLVVYERLDAPVANSSSSTADRFSGTIREVSSESNPTFKLCRELQTGRGIRKRGQAILSGRRPITEVLARFPEYAEAWITPPDGEAPPVESLPWLRFADPLFKEMDTAGTRSPLLLARVPETPEWTDELDWPLGCTLFIPFQDPENVGALIRSAAAFGVARVVLLKEAAHPFHPKSVRAGGPALFQVPLFLGPSIQEVASSRFPLFALDMEGEELGQSPCPERFGLIPGVEGPGLPPRLREGPKRRIAIAEGVESLNAATAAAIALYAWKQEGGRADQSSPTIE